MREGNKLQDNIFYNHLPVMSEIESEDNRNCVISSVQNGGLWIKVPLGILSVINLLISKVKRLINIFAKPSFIIGGRIASTTFC